MKRTIIAILAIVALVVAGGFLFGLTKKGRQPVDFIEGMAWLCTSCQEGFTVSREEYAAWLRKHPGEQFECPKCHKHAAVPAYRCPLPDCGKYYTQRYEVINGRVCCPVCRQPIP